MENEQPKLDSTRRLRGIYFIDLDDQDYNETLKHARRQLERSMDAAMQCKRKARTSNTKVAAEVMTIHRNSANLVKIYHGIIQLQHLIDPRRMISLKERYAEYLWWSGRRSGCPHSLLQRSSAGLPCPSCMGAQGTARGGRGRRGQTGARGGSGKWRGSNQGDAPCG